MTANFNTPSTPDHNTKKWRRSLKNRQLMGVCQGLANYFGIPVILVRCAFIISSLFGGWGILVYLILCLGETQEQEKDIPKIVNAIYTNDQKQKIESISVSFVAKFFRLLSLLLFSAIVYFPVLALLSIIGIVVIISFFYSLLSIQGYHFSLPDLGLEGWLIGFSWLLLVTLAIYIACSWIMYFHLQRQHLKKKLMKCFILFLSVLSITISTMAIIAYSFFNIQLEKTWIGEEKHNIDFTSWQKHISTLNVHIHKVVFISHKSPTVKISYVLRANGLQKKQIVEFLQQVELDLSQLSKPRWKSNFLLPKQFVPKLEIVIQLPEKTSIELPKKIAPIEIRGVFANINIDIENQSIQIDNSKINKLILHCTDGQVKIEQSTGNELTIISKKSSLYLQNNHFAKYKIFNEYGDIQSKEMTGQVEIQSNSGTLYLKDPNFTANSIIYISSGKANISFMESIPIIDIDEIGSKIRNNTFLQKTNEYTLQLHLENAHLILDQEHNNIQK